MYSMLCRILVPKDGASELKDNIKNLHGYRLSGNWGVTPPASEVEDKR